MLQSLLRGSRQTPCRSESNAVSVAIMNSVLTVVAGVCIHYLYTDTVNILYAIQGGLMLWMVLICNIAILSGKISMARNLSRQTEAFEEDERYDVIKEDAVSHQSGEAMEMGETPTQFENKGYDDEEGPPTFSY